MEFSMQRSTEISEAYKVREGATLCLVCPPSQAAQSDKSRAAEDSSSNKAALSSQPQRASGRIYRPSFSQPRHNCKDKHTHIYRCFMMSCIRHYLHLWLSHWSRKLSVTHTSNPTHVQKQAYIYGACRIKQTQTCSADLHMHT